MDHVAIIKEPFFSFILTQKKTIESRWYMTRRAPWNKIKAGETIYFKPSSKPVLAKAIVKQVHQFKDLTPLRVREIIDEYPQIYFTDKEKSFEQNKHKKYCVLVDLKNVEVLIPFNIDKKGFGNQSAWLCVDDINSIKL